MNLSYKLVLLHNYIAAVACSPQQAVTARSLVTRNASVLLVMAGSPGKYTTHFVSGLFSDFEQRLQNEIMLVRFVIRRHIAPYNLKNSSKYLTSLTFWP